MDKKIVIGWIGKIKVLIDVKIEEKKGEFETNDHKTIKNPLVLSISGHGHIPNKRDSEFCGQIYDELKNIDTFLINKDKITRIIKVWKEWHLNYLTPNCIHQKSFNVNDKNWTEKAQTETNNCPLKYRYGSKWLITKLPEAIIKEVEEW